MHPTAASRSLARRRLSRSVVETLEHRRLLSVAGPVVEVDINFADKEQRIDGFGSSVIDWDSPEAYERAEFYNEVANDLGSTIVRIPASREFEDINDDDDPYTSDPDNFYSLALKPTMEYVQELEKRQDQTVLLGVWSPPWFMKVSHDYRGGAGNVKPEMRLEFAEYLAEYVIAAERDWGVTIDVVALQNEPLFVQTFPNAHYTPHTMAETFVVVHDYFQLRGLDTKLMIAEDLNFGRRFEEWTGALVDAYDRRNRDLPEELIWGTHFGPTTDTKVWEDVTQQTNRAIWSTESGGKGTTSISGGLAYLEETLLYLDDGKLSAHITWQSVGDGTSSWYYLDGVDENGDDFFQKSGTYAATKHIARWVRPGSNLVESSMTNRDLDGSGGGRVIAAAFETAENDANTVVLTNRAQFDREVVINLNNFDTHGMGGDDWRAYFTEEADNGQQETWVRLASQDGTGEVPLTVSPDGTSISFVMPARSMLTLTNIDGEPIDAVEADATRIYQYAQQGIGLQRMSYFHRVVGVGWQQGVLQEITDSRMLQVFEPSGRNVLHLAAGINNGDITNTLSHVLDRAEILGMDINAQGFDGMTPLMIASASQMAGISFTTDVGGIFLVQPEDTRARINTLIDAGGDLHVKDDHGRTALHWSAITARAEVSTTIDVVSPHTKLLLEQGADANKVDAFGRTAYDWAILEGNPEAAAELAAWTTDTAAPELLAVESQMSGSYIGATLTFDEAIGTVSDGDFVLVRDDGTTASTRIRSVTTLAGGNTQVVVEAVDGMFLPAGHWRVYPTGNVQDLAGNAFELPPESRGMFGFSSAELDYLPADFDGDQAVTLADFAILRANFNSPGLTGGDANGDGWVNLIDFALLRTSFGVSLIGGPDGDFGGRESTPAMDIIADFAGGLDDGNGFDSGPSNRSVAAYSPTSDTPFSRGGLFDADDEV